MSCLLPMNTNKIQKPLRHAQVAPLVAYQEASDLTIVVVPGYPLVKIMGISWENDRKMRKSSEHRKMMEHDDIPSGKPTVYYGKWPSQRLFFP